MNKKICIAATIPFVVITMYGLIELIAYIVTGQSFNVMGMDNDRVATLAALWFVMLIIVTVLWSFAESR